MDIELVDIRQRLLKRGTAAEILDAGVSTVDKLIDSGELEYRTYGHGVGKKIVGQSLFDYILSGGVPVE